MPDSSLQACPSEMSEVLTQLGEQHFCHICQSRCRRVCTQPARQAESVQGPCEQLAWQAVKCSLRVPLHLLPVPRAGPGALGGWAQEPSALGDQPRAAAAGRDPSWERPQCQGASAQRCWAQQSSKGLLLGRCSQGPKGWAALPAMAHPGHTWGRQLPVTVGEQGCCGTQGSAILSKAADKSPGGRWTAAVPGSRGCF